MSNNNNWRVTRLLFTLFMAGTILGEVVLWPQNTDAYLSFIRSLGIGVVATLAGLVVLDLTGVVK
jgi:hypothetical protein